MACLPRFISTSLNRSCTQIRECVKPAKTSGTSPAATAANHRVPPARTAGASCDAFGPVSHPFGAARQSAYCNTSAAPDLVPRQSARPCESASARTCAARMGVKSFPAHVRMPPFRPFPGHAWHGAACQEGSATSATRRCASVIRYAAWHGQPALAPPGLPVADPTHPTHPHIGTSGRLCQSGQVSCGLADRAMSRVAPS